MYYSSRKTLKFKQSHNNAEDLHQISLKFDFSNNIFEINFYNRITFGKSKERL
ncbi:hypothetical protein LEP1GSC171_1820 [Leptospira santarosai str. HAI1380]|uniref:Uncharacterized protein n=1 Tax=Leptospira santarosai str. MOR084 TaxID=1049984 RepID=A0A0E2BHP8_9LEPT|nr:hypothetical protein LEP1GSC179_1552 [Leptospira santarosai str. MOR084]EKR91381.1 hypothetical protein LEP1GSC163_0720 [Leptospira santarosai str. CBC379]EMM77350.1 hypothetical protein LEP1GSC040_1491 [Leptospira santarosai str. 2000030832]EMP04026.1 hypothetical protein LEP1GSC171_1820 [Leptospira santarosai str. HAI1380]